MDKNDSSDLERLNITLEDLSMNQKAELMKILRPDLRPNKRKRNVYSEDFQKQVIEIWKRNRNYSLTAENLNKELKDKGIMSSIDENYIRRWVSEIVDTDVKKKVLKKGQAHQTKGEIC